jgi:hypothetical protein
MKTAVEWLEDELLSGKLLMWTLVNQAKEIEKQLLKKAWQDSETNMRNTFSSSAYKNISFDEWFKQLEK